MVAIAWILFLFFDIKRYNKKLDSFLISQNPTEINDMEKIPARSNQASNIIYTQNGIKTDNIYDTKESVSKKIKNAVYNDIKQAKQIGTFF